MPKTVVTSKAPSAIGPYSQAMIAGGMVYCSGQIALTATSSTLVGNTAEEQALQCLKNLAEVLKAANSSPALVVKTTLYLKDLNDFAAINRVYGDFFGDHKPARATVEVARLPKDALVEIDCVAIENR